MPALASALDDVLHRRTTYRAGIRLGIGTNRIGVRAVDIEGVDDERQVGNTVRFRAHDALSIPLDEAVLDYHVVSESVDESGTVSSSRLLAAAYRSRSTTTSRRAAWPGRAAGIDIEAFALLRALSAADSDPRRRAAVASVVVSIGHDRSTLAIWDGAISNFMRVLDWGGAQPRSAIARALGLTGDEAATLKLPLHLARTSTRTTRDPHVRAPAPPSSPSCRPSRTR